MIGKRWVFLGLGENGREYIGDDNPAGPMMMRLRLLQTPWGGIYLHFIYREDLDRYPHDHPWVFWTLILRGSYTELYYDDAARVGTAYGRPQAWWRGQFRRFPLSDAHRITSVVKGTTTLVFVGPKVRQWGFFNESHGWFPWNGRNGGTPSRGMRPYDEGMERTTT